MKRPRRGAQVELGELLSAAGAMALLLIMFAVAWFGTVRPPGSVTGAALESSVDAWNGLSVVRWLLVVTILVAVGGLVLHVAQSTRGVRTRTGAATLGAGGLAAVLVGWRVLVNLPQGERIVDAKLGAYLGLLCTVAVALGGWRTLTEERRVRHVEAAEARHAARGRRVSAPERP